MNFPRSFLSKCAIPVIIHLTLVQHIQAQCCNPAATPPCPCPCSMDYTSCDSILPIPSKVSISVGGYWRVIQSNGIPNHAIGKFPLIYSEDLSSLTLVQKMDQCCCGRPDSLKEQDYIFVIPAYPITGLTPISTSVFNLPVPPFNVDPPMTFGVAVNGVPFDPAAAEWWDPLNHTWAYNAIRHPEMQSDLDCNNGHVQTTGAYHYHGFPTGLYDTISVSQAASTDSRTKARYKIVLLGWAFDGSPIYGEECGEDTISIQYPTSSWRMKSGARPPMSPGGNYNGDYVDDFEFDPGSGDLDECNGHLGPTPEYPDGVYHYHILKRRESYPIGFPYIGRCYSNKNCKNGPQIFPRG